MVPKTIDLRSGLLGALMPPQFTAFLRSTPHKSCQRPEFRRPVRIKQAGQWKVSQTQGVGSPAHAHRRATPRRPYCGKQPPYPPQLRASRRHLVLRACVLRRWPRRQGRLLMLLGRPGLGSRRAASAPLGWALERATGGCAQARPEWRTARRCGALSGEQRWGD